MGTGLLDAIGSLQLEGWAGERAVERGREHVEAGRVTRPAIGTSQASAYVGDPRRGRVRARLLLSSAGDIAGRCTCRARSMPCSHAAALALLVTGGAWPGGEDDEPPVEDLEARQIERRVQRGRSGVFAVRPLGDRDAVYGDYRIGSPSDRSYQVRIRAVDERHNSCTCDDLRTNRVGTCKHIEAVLAWAGRGRRAARLRRARKAGPPRSYLYLEPGGEPAVRLRLKRRPGPRAHAFARRWFDGGGVLRAPLGEAWHRLRDEAGSAGVEVPDEVRERAERAIREDLDRRRRADIERAVRRAGVRQPGFRGRLYPYQIDGVAFLASRGRALLGDDMGLGKTAQAIAAMVRLMRRGDVERVLVVCPASLKHQWAHEIDKFTGGPTRGPRVAVVAGTRREREALYREPANVVIVNYELVRNDEKAIAGLGADLLILDEAQRVKNWRTKTASAVKRLRSRHAFVLTGTPLENRLDDLYSLMQVVDPHVLGPLWCFNRDFIATDERGKPLGYRNLGELRERIRPCFLRRRKEEVLDQLPDTMTTRLSVPLEGAQRDIHDEAEAKVARLLAILRRRPLSPPEEQRLMRGFQSMRMACDAASLCGGKDARRGPPKLRELERLLEEICLDAGHKVVVFSEWEKMQRLAAGVAERLGIGHVRLHGGVPSQRRGALVERFFDDPSCKVFLSTDAGGVGLNLQAASHVINLDLPWNPAVLAQRIGRVHRIGQPSAVNVVVMVGADSIEERMEGTLADKRTLFSAAVGDSEADAVERSNMARRIATLLTESYAADTARTPRSAAPADQRDDGVARVREQLGDSVRQLVRTRDGRLVALVADGVSAPEPPPGLELAVLPVQAARSLEALGDSSPLAGAEVLYEQPEQPDVADGARRRAHLSAAHRKLAAARTLVDAGMGAEALGLLRGALALCCRAAATSDPGADDGAVLATLYDDLVPAGAVSTQQAHALARAGELARAFDASPTAPADHLVRDLLDEATDFATRLREDLGRPAAPERASAA